MKDLKVKAPVSEGWAVHIYDGDRHLRCTLESSHGWAFATGLGLGIVIATVGVSLNQLAGSRASAARPPVPTSSSPTAGSSRHSLDESIFWID